MNNDFSFENTNEINSCINTLDQILVLSNFDNLYKDRELVENAKKLLKNIAGASPISLVWFDEKSVYTRDIWKNYIKSFAEPPEQIQSLLPYTMDSLLLFLSFLSIEITWGDFRDLERGKGSVARPESHIALLEEMGNYIDCFTLTSNQRKYAKNRAKNYTNHLSSIDLVAIKNKIQEQVNRAEELNSEAEKVVEEAQKIVPKKISESLEENSKKLGGEFTFLLFWKQIERLFTFAMLASMGILIVWLAAEIASPETIRGPLAFAPQLIEYTQVFDNANLSKIMVFDNTVTQKDTSQSSWNNFDIKTLTPIALEILLIYFFRIVLRGYNKITTEITQLQNRKILTKFLPAYAEYAKNNKDNPVLEHFSNFIFKPLISDSTDTPKLIDGFKVVSGFNKKNNSINENTP